MLNRPQIKASFDVQIFGADQVFLLAEDKHAVLQGRVYPLLAPLLTGEHSLADLLERLGGRVPAPELFYALTHLERRGYIVEGCPEAPPAEAAYWHLLGHGAAAAAERLRDTPVSLRVLGGAGEGALRDALAGAGVRLADGGEGLPLILADDYLAPELEALNAQMLAAGRPWVLVRLAGSSPWVGPLFVPGATGCWSCLADRLRANRQLESYILRRTGREGPLPQVLGALPTSLAAGANLAATELVKWIVRRETPQIAGRLLALDMASLELQPHALVRRPQCPSCGDPERYRRPAPVALQERKKRYTSDGGHRGATPEETFARCRHQISPITGVISSLTDLTGGQGEGLVYSYSAGHNFALIRDNLYWLRRNLRSTTGGKGTTEIQARVSAMSEAIERYAGVYRGEEPALRGSYRSLGPAAIHVGEVLQFSPAQYANRRVWNERTDMARFNRVLEPFDEGRELDWSPLWSLTRQEFRYLPSSYCYYGHPEDQRFYYCTADGNGCAAGNSIEEAILQGFLELVERDSAAIWWYNRIPRPAVDLDSFALPYLDAIRAHYRQLQRELWVLDLTSDLGIPTFAAISRRTDRRPEDIIIGLGAHLEPKTALLRAIAELNQFLPAVARRAPDGSTVYDFPDDAAGLWWRTATLASEPYVAPDPAQPARRAEEYRSLAGDDLRADVETCVAVAERAGLETLVLDQTRPDIEMAVCRVVVPGLRHFWRRLGPGRLYDVPVRLGWLDAPTPEDELNPFSIFF